MSFFAGRIFVFAERGHARALVVLAVLCLVLFAPGFAGLPPMDRDEPRFAQATKQMLETGDFVDIRFQTEARHKKPVGIYWMQAAVVEAAAAIGAADAERTIWLYRIPSLLGAILATLMTYTAAAALTTRRAAFIASALFAATTLLGVEARLAKTDAVVAATVCVAMAALARAWTRRDQPGEALSYGWALAFWIAVGVGILVKGPITPAVPLLAALILSWSARSGAWLRPLRPWAGLAIVLLIVAPWFVAIAMKTGGSFFAESVGEDMLAKVGAGQEAHGAPPGTYLAALAGTAWPLAPFLLLALPFAWRNRRDPAVMFCVAWALPLWIVFELVPTKLPHYVLPLYPALAIMVGLAAERRALAREGWVPRVVVALLPLLAFVLAVAVGVGVVALDDTVPVVSLILLAGALGIAAASWREFFRQRDGTAALGAVAASALIAWGVYAFAVPLLRSVAISPRLAAAASAAGCTPSAFAAAGYREPSLVFLTASDLVMTDGAGAAEVLALGGCRIAFVEKRLEPAFLAGATAAGQTPRLLSRVAGLNLNGGRTLDISVYRGP